MRSTITARGQTVIPAEIRRQFHLTPADRLEWIVDAAGIHVKPVQNDPIQAFRGSGSGTGGAVDRLLAERAKDRDHE